MAAKPTMFIGSSTESLNLARAVQAELLYDVDSTIWNQGSFELSRSTLRELSEATQQFDYATFVLAPDDIQVIRNDPKKVARDNVLFELGMFFGALGIERCFFLVPMNVSDFHLPTDLAGITPAKYDPGHSGGLQAAVGPACNQIRLAISGGGRLVSLSGEWNQVWSVTIGGERKQFPSKAIVIQAGTRIRATFEALAKTYELEGRIERGNLLTGRWSDQHGGPTYFGTFQLVISPLADKMQGKWVGWSQRGSIRAGDWVWERDN